MMVDVAKVKEFEEAKQAILHIFERGFHTYILDDSIRDMHGLFEKIMSWIGTSKPPTGLLHTFAEESLYCSAAQKRLLSQQERLFERLRNKLAQAVAVMKEHKFDPEEFDKSRVAPKIAEIVEKIFLNSSEIIKVPGAKRKAA